MNSRTTERFRRAFAELPIEIQRQAREAYRAFQRNPAHPGLSFKPIHARRPIYSVRICRNYRAVGLRDGDLMLWFWIGTHAEYERVIQRL